MNFNKNEFSLQQIKISKIPSYTFEVQPLAVLMKYESQFYLFEEKTR